MARKQLVKGANAVRVEERIARIPQDIEPELGIFGAIKAMEGRQEAEKASASAQNRPDKEGAAAKNKAARKAAPARKVKPATQAAPARKAKAAQNLEAEPISEAKPTSEAEHSSETSPFSETRAKAGTKAENLHFTHAERETIIRCCEDYRNRLPIYLASVQKEVLLIDAIITKCGGDNK